MHTASYSNMQSRHASVATILIAEDEIFFILESTKPLSSVHHLSCSRPKHTPYDKEYMRQLNVCERRLLRHLQQHCWRTGHSNTGRTSWLFTTQQAPGHNSLQQHPDGAHTYCKHQDEQHTGKPRDFHSLLQPVHSALLTKQLHSMCAASHTPLCLHN